MLKRRAVRVSAYRGEPSSGAASAFGGFLFFIQKRRLVEFERSESAQRFEALQNAALRSVSTRGKDASSASVKDEKIFFENFFY